MAEVQQTENLSASREVDTQDIMRQIMDYMKVQLKPETTSLEMQLHPANLGTLQIQMATKGGSLTANFITQNEAVKAALESQMVQLQQSFEEQGIKVNSIEVTVQPHAFEQDLEARAGEITPIRISRAEEGTAESIWTPYRTRQSSEALQRKNSLQRKC